MARKKKKADAQTSSGPVWSRRVGGNAGRDNVAYCAGYDVRPRPEADWRLLPYDIWTNRAHCAMLTRAGIVAPKTLDAILKALDALQQEWQAGNFQLDPALEDVHLNIEAYVEKRAGAEIAGVMHTARSRNDQVATSMRLWLRDALVQFASQALDLVATLGRMARREAETPMPGLTHHQPGAWTTFGHWAAAHAGAFRRDILAILDLLAMLGQCCPLGAAASFGTSWPIDRAYSAKLLGFRAPQDNSLDAVTNRCEFEARAAGIMAQWAQHAATLCQDLILFSSPPWSVLRLDDAYVTGSSIMPQKRNPDFAEVTKAKASLAGGLAATLLDLTRGDPSGYNREQQWSKYMIFDLFDELAPAPAILGGALGSLRLDRPRMRQIMQHDFLEGADIADYLAQTRHRPFRTAYRWMGEAVRRCEEEEIELPEAVNRVLRQEGDVAPLSQEEAARLMSPDHAIARRRSLGGPSPQEVRRQSDALRAQIAEARKSIRREQRGVESARKKLARQEAALRAGKR